jgi:hypothetical protein
VTDNQQNAMPLPRRKPVIAADPLPAREPRAASGEATRRGAEPVPQRGAEPLPQRGAEPLPQRGAEPLPRRGEPLPQRGQPATGQPADGLSELPRRTTRMRRSGRHRSPHRISVAPDAPMLVLAVPHAATSASADLARHIAEATARSCPGVEIRAGFLNGFVQPLGAALEFPEADQQDQGPRAVVVPLLAGPHLTIDGQLETAVGAAWAPVMLAAHLGPHPLLAEALHDRLAEAGLARHSRARGLNISSGADGILVLADRGAAAASDAGVTAVLLAGRLAVPTAPASLGDPASIEAGLARLRQAGATRLAISPCVIGPETRHDEIAELSAVTGAPAAAPLAAHPIVGQLVSIRYGEALAQLSPAGG